MLLVEKGRVYACVVERENKWQIVTEDALATARGGGILTPALSVALGFRVRGYLHGQHVAF